MNDSGKKVIPLWMAIVPIVVLIGLLVVNVQLYGDSASSGPNQIALFFAAATASVFGLMVRVPFKQMLEGVLKSLNSAMMALILLLLIGALTGTWMISGIVPAMIYYGLDLLNPQIFLFASVVVCAIVSVATGSSWSTIATVGVALLGIGDALGVSPGMAAGAIISGAYFGDKLSPLSDTTNLAAAMADVDLIAHIRYMLWTTIPSITITLIIFLLIGYSGEVHQANTIDASQLKEALAQNFNLTPWLFLVPVAVLVMVCLRVDAMAAMFAGVLLGAVFALIFQPNVVKIVSGEKNISSESSLTATQGYRAVINAMSTETSAIADRKKTSWTESRDAILLDRARQASSNPDLTMEQYQENAADIKIDKETEFDTKLAAAKLMKGKGMEGMLTTVWLVVSAMCFGGVMEACGFLKRITDPLVGMAKTDGSLVATTAGSCLFVNATASDQYLAIVVPGQMFGESFEERGLDGRNLSRTLEDSGTVTSVLIPWNTCGAAQSSVLSVGVLTFAPWCFFNIISPFMTVAYAYLGLKIARIKKPTSS